MPSRCILIAAIGLALAACDGSGGTAPGAVSEGEARALEEAAEMLDKQRPPKGILPETEAPGAAETPDVEDKAPSEMTGDRAG